MYSFEKYVIIRKKN